ncbi:YlaH-like family protein [Paenibacillus spongiae]|uniref:YlaH-like family protein n=1 Tax=Paenibacillus spongiae TaxID=2909671 RepID=A0ABY5SDW8_9BACL|nr:YlaH-like family protein [Paenibacillus spongiae]UVI32169.1 YlaH-like family protein [Paenibacillus spongiae]
MQEWLQNHPLITYILIFCFVLYIFNAVFRVQRLPILKEILVHIVMAVGSFVLFILQIDKLPIVQCLSVAVAMMLLLRGRQLYDKWKGNGTKSKDSEPGAPSSAAIQNERK